MSSRSILLSELALLGVVLIWGVNFTVMKAAVGRVDALSFNAARFTLSVLFLGLLYARESRRTRAPFWPPRSILVSVLGLSLCGHVAYQVGFVTGLDRTTSGTASLLIASSPLWTGLIAHVAGFERLGVRAWSGLLVAFAGTAIVAGGTGVEFGREALVGNLLCAGAAFFWGIYTAWSRPMLERASSLALAFWTMLVALPVLWIVAIPGLRALDVNQLDAAVLGAATYAGLFGTGVAYVLWNVGVRHVGPSRTATVTCIVPLIALALGALVLREPIQPIQVGGGLVVLVGIVTMGRARASAATG